MRQRYTTVVIADEGTESGAFTPPAWAKHIGAIFPAMDNGAVSVQMSIDGTNYVTISDPQDDGTALVIQASGVDPNAIDLSYFLYPFIGNFTTGTTQITPIFRFKAATTQSTGAVTITVTFKD